MKIDMLKSKVYCGGVEIFPLACRNVSNGGFPLVDKIAWTIHLSLDKIMKDLRGLDEVNKHK
jgi:hypothetical protein